MKSKPFPTLPYLVPEGCINRRGYTFSKNNLNIGGGEVVIKQGWYTVFRNSLDWVDGNERRMTM